MKRSELKEAIKAEIKSVLLEASESEMIYNLDLIAPDGTSGGKLSKQDEELLQMFKNMDGNELKKYAKVAAQEQDEITQDTYFNFLRSLPNYKDEFTPANLREVNEEITEAKFIKFKGDSDDNKMEVEAEREMNTPDGELKVYTVKTDDGVQSYTADQVELVEVYQTNSKMSQIVSLFQDMMDDEYDGQDYRKVLNIVLKAIDDDYKAAEREGEKFSRIREEDEAPAGDKKTEKAARGADKAKDDYAKLAGKDNTEISKASSLVKEKAKKAKEGDKEALNFLKSNQKVIKAYNDLKK